MQKFLLAYLKTLTNSKECSRCHWSIFSSVHGIAGFHNNLQNHRRLSEQFSESQAAFGTPFEVTAAI
jgi:hypothetical protein